MAITLAFDVALVVPVAPERAFDHTVDAAHLPSFVGFGPIPGIAAAEDLDPPGPGARRRVFNVDGTSHLETFTAFERPTLHVARIHGLSRPFSWLVREIEDRWIFEPSATGTAIARRFTFTLTGPFAWLPARLLLGPFKQAVALHMRAVSRALSAAAAPPPG